MSQGQEYSTVYVKSQTPRGQEFRQQEPTPRGQQAAPSARSIPQRQEIATPAMVEVYEPGYVNKYKAWYKLVLEKIMTFCL